MGAESWTTPFASRMARRAATLAFVACFAATDVAARSKHPIPPRRPDLPAATPATIKPTPPKLSEQPGSSDSADACFTKLRAAGVAFEQAPMPTATLDGCGVDAPVRVSSIALRSGGVELSAKPLLGCSFALQFSDFIRNLVAPLGSATMEASLVAIDSGPGYECRGRNRSADAKISAHGKGVAIDVTAFVFANGRRVTVESQSDAQAATYIKTLRTAACGWFMTVLGPGADPYHAIHLHFDIERHGSSDAYRICQ